MYDDENCGCGPLRAIFHARKECRGTARMMQVANRKRLDDFVDGLNREQAIIFMMVIDPCNREILPQLHGEMVTILRLVHGVDPATGLTEAEAQEREMVSGKD